MKPIPQILIPSEKIPLFEKWWDEDIRFESTLPHAFEEGYLVYNNKLDMNTDEVRAWIKFTAHQTHSTYREVENDLKRINDRSTMLYFKFLKEDQIYMERYEDERLCSKGTFTVGDNGGGGDLESIVNMKEVMRLVTMDVGSVSKEAKERAMQIINTYSAAILASALWYIATNKSTRYIYTTEAPVIERTKKVAQVKDTKKISTPIYDFNKVRVVSLDNLKRRKQGWTYSHAFTVHGHYRHYRTGKTTFVKSYVKGKGKELKNQEIILAPTTYEKEENVV